MANSIATIDMLNRSALKYAHESMSFLANVDKQFDKSFDGSTKHGSTLRLKNPAQFNVESGTRIANVQNITDTTQTLTVDTPYHVSFEVTSQDLLQGIAYMNEEYIKPAAKRLVAQVEGAALAEFTKDIYQVVGAGTYSEAGGFAPGTVLSGLTAPNRAKAFLGLQAAPDDNRCVIANGINQGTMVDGMSGLFNPSDDGSKRFREGLVGRTSMASWYENEKCIAITNAADVVGAINNGSLVSGISALTVDGFTTIGGAGTVFTVAGIYDVHTETKTASNRLKQFVVTSGATTTNLTFSPDMVFDTANPAQNCSGTPADGDVITFYGSASTAYDQSIMFQKDAFTFVSAKLPSLASKDDMSSLVEDNLSMRLWKASDIVNDRMIIRMDMLCGWKTTRPEFACRISA